MLSLKTALLAALAVLSLGYVLFWWRRLATHARAGGTERLEGPPTPLQLAIGFVTNFFDTLGIGSFAPTTAAFKLWTLVPDEAIPGTLNAGHALAAVTQAFIYIAIVDVRVTTLISLIVAAMLGSWLGAGIVGHWSRRKVQIGMGLALCAAALFFVLKNLDELRGAPVIPGGDALGLDGALLAVGIVGNFALGALMTLGIGLYAPCLILISLLGMNPLAAFPIMMGSCAFLMPIASIRFITLGRYAARPALGLTLGGIPAVLVAAYLVKSLPLTWVRWLVVIVVLYTSVMMLRSAARERRSGGR